MNGFGDQKMATYNFWPRKGNFLEFLEFEGAAVSPVGLGIEEKCVPHHEDVCALVESGKCMFEWRKMETVMLTQRGEMLES